MRHRERFQGTLRATRVRRRVVEAGLPIPERGAVPGTTVAPRATERRELSRISSGIRPSDLVIYCTEGIERDTIQLSAGKGRWMVDQSYDVFLSYARVDQENDQFVSKLALEMERIFQFRTGQLLRIFIDTREIATAQAWRDRIEGALARSTFMVAVLTPSYFTSEWCVREWEWFVERERLHRREGNLDSSDALIFPIRFRDLSRVLNPSARQHVEAALARQYRDLTNVDPESPRFAEEVNELVIHMIDALVRHGERSNLQSGSHNPPLRTKIRQDDIFIQQLSVASRVTIVGLTNVRLRDFLEEAIKRKRMVDGPNAFWSSIRVVFSSKALLNFMHDELDTEFPKRNEATHARSQQADYGRKAVGSFLLRAHRPSLWMMCEYPFLPPFVGTMLEMPDGSKHIQVATLRPSYSVADYLFLEFSQRAGEIAYYQAAFEEIVHHSEQVDEITLVGVPAEPIGQGFYCHGARFRRAVLSEGRDPADWLPGVVLCSYREGSTGAQPLLQIRTRSNAAREIHRISHVSGYVRLQDCEENSLDAHTEFRLTESAVYNAAVRKLREELSLNGEPELIDQLPYYSSNTESLYFYLFAHRMPADTHRFPAEVRILPWTMLDLLRLRDYQVLSQVETFLQARIPTDQATVVARVLSLNLMVGGRKDLARRLMDEAHLRESTNALLDEVRNLRESVVPRQLAPSGGPVIGLAGLQFREFFSWLLPFYETISVPGAKDELDRISDDPESKVALERLTALYRSASDMKLMSAEIEG